jgi:hypothetical protein
MAFRVELTASAKYESDVIPAWLLTNKAGETGLRWWRKMKEAIDSLTEFPNRCALAPENDAFSFEVR